MFDDSGEISSGGDVSDDTADVSTQEADGEADDETDGNAGDGLNEGEGKEVTDPDAVETNEGPLADDAKSTYDDMMANFFGKPEGNSAEPDAEQEAPEEIGTDKPDEGKAEEPGDGKPEDIEEAETDKPDEGKPEEPGDGEPEDIEEAETDKPDEGKAEEPGDGEPEDIEEAENDKPDEGKAEEPGDGEPEDIEEAENDKPDEGKAEEPGEGERVAENPNFADKPEKSEFKESKDNLNEFVKSDKDVSEKDINMNELPEFMKERTDNNKLSYEKIKAICKETGWSPEVVNDMRTMKEVQHYKDLGLKEHIIGGKTVLMKDGAIDWDQVAPDGKTNRERVEAGLVPIAPNGEKIELHHIGQKDGGYYAVLTRTEHRGKGIDNVLHDKTKDSEINRNSFTKERQDIWKSAVAEHDAQ